MEGHQPSATGVTLRYMMAMFECQQINNFVGFNPEERWLRSVLWPLSELIVIQFGTGR